MKKLLAFFILSLIIFGKENYYNGNFNGHEGPIKLSSSIENNKKIYIIEVGDYSEYFEIDENFETIFWILNRPSEKSYIEGKNMGDYVTLKGKFEGKEINKDLYLEGDKWIQFIPLGLGLKDIEYFKAIATMGPKAMNFGRMVSKIKGTEKINELECTHLKIRLTGILAFAWKGEYWYDIKKDILVRVEDEYSSLELDTNKK